MRNNNDREKDRAEILGTKKAYVVKVYFKNNDKEDVTLNKNTEYLLNDLKEKNINVNNIDNFIVFREESIIVEYKGKKKFLLWSKVRMKPEESKLIDTITKTLFKTEDSQEAKNIIVEKYRK